MSVLSNLKPAKGSVRKNKRRARGQGSGSGGTASRGHKGAKSRSGYSKKRAHEGGQTPIQMRLPKRGFNNPTRVAYVALNLEKVQYLAEKHDLSEISFEKMRELRLVKKTDRVKVLGKGELKRPLNITLHAFSETAKKAIEEAGGTASIIGG